MAVTADFWSDAVTRPPKREPAPLPKRRSMSTMRKLSYAIERDDLSQRSLLDWQERSHLVPARADHPDSTGDDEHQKIARKRERESSANREQGPVISTLRRPIRSACVVRIEGYCGVSGER